MPLVNIDCLKYTEDCALFKYVNETVYGAPNQDRNQAAEYLLVAHITTEALEEFITVDSQNYLTKLEYDISNTLDGHYRFERLRFPIWANDVAVAEIKDVNNVITTYATLRYYTPTNKFYKCILGHSNIAPDAINGATYWQEITSFTTADIRKNTTIEVFVSDKLFDCRGKKCTKKELLKVGCSCTDNINKLMPYLKRKVLLNGARAKAADLKPEQAELITRQLSDLCNCND